MPQDTCSVCVQYVCMHVCVYLGWGCVVQFTSKGEKGCEDKYTFFIYDFVVYKKRCVLKIIDLFFFITRFFFVLEKETSTVVRG